MGDFENAQSYLKNASGPSGTATLYDHLAGVLQNIIANKPDSCLDTFEKLSVGLKKNDQPVDFLKVASHLPHDKVTQDKLQSALQRTRDLLKPPRAVDDDGEEEELPEHVEVPDFLGQLDMLQWAGINLGQENNLQLALSIQNLATEKELENVRFFGKILGTKADYYIVEARMNDVEDPEDNEEDPNYVETKKREPSGEPGCNEFVYFVANTVSAKTSEWTMLPAVIPHMITVARESQRFFTGDLNAVVHGLPRFPYGEAAFLRATIARISASTQVCPRGMFTTDEEDESREISVNDEYIPAPVASLASLDNWIHYRPFLLAEGRVTAYVDPEEDIDDEEQERRDAAAEKPPPACNTLSNDIDTRYGDGQASGYVNGLWQLKLHTMGITLGGKDVHTYASAHSLLWPGAVTVTKNGEYAHIYVGFGQKYNAKKYQPPLPPPVLNEYIYVAPPRNEDDDEDEVKYDPNVNPLVEGVDPQPPTGWTEPKRDEDDEEAAKEEDVDEDDYI